MDAFERNASIDLLRGISAFGIVGCHLCLSPLTQWGSFTLSFCDLNVGIFAAISGFLMASGRSCNWYEYVWRRARRILPVYLVWTIVYVAASSCFQYVGSGAVKPHYGECHYWKSVLFFGGASCHLWFLICLFYAQGVFKPVSTLKLNGHVWVIVGFATMTFCSLVNDWFCNYPFRLLAFLVSGYGLGKIERKTWGWTIVLVPVTLVLHAVLRNVVGDYLCDWIVVVTVMTSLPVHVDFTGHLARTVSFLGATSMGVYLIHPLVTRGLSVLVGKFDAGPYGVLSVGAFWVVSWVIALMVSACFRRLPKFSWMVK